MEGPNQVSSRGARWAAVAAGVVMLAGAAIAIAAGAADSLVSVPFQTDSDLSSGGLALVALGLAVTAAVPFVVAAISRARAGRAGLAGVVVAAAVWGICQVIFGTADVADVVAVTAGAGAMTAVSLRRDGTGALAARAIATVVVTVFAALAFSEHPEYGMLLALPAVALADEASARR